MRPQALRSGTLPASSLRVWTALIALVAVTWRLFVHLASGRAVPAPPAGLTEFLTSPDHIWTAPPLPGLILAVAHHFSQPENLLIALELIAVVTVVVLLVRLGSRWLDYRVGLLAAVAWASCGPAVAVFRVPGSEGWQATLSILCAAAMLRVARRRAPREAWRIGAVAGVLTLFSGGGILWLLASHAWLPVTSRKFRGRQWFVLSGLMLAGWIAVVLPVAARNAILTGGDPVLPIADGAGRFYVAMTEPGLSSVSAIEARSRAAIALEESGVAPSASEWTRSSRLVGLALAAGGEGYAAAGKRFVALLGGWLPPAEYPAWTLPWWWLVLGAWVGVVALVPGTRFLFPMLLGGLVPLLQGMLFGVDSGTVLTATPFICIYVAYGVWRVLTARQSSGTWAALAVVLFLATLVHLGVRAWS